jgi:hypothetical protein
MAETKGGLYGAQRVEGSGKVTPVAALSERCFTIAAASGFRIGLL